MTIGMMSSPPNGGRSWKKIDIVSRLSLRMQRERIIRLVTGEDNAVIRFYDRSRF